MSELDLFVRLDIGNEPIELKSGSAEAGAGLGQQ